MSTTGSPLYRYGSTSRSPTINKNMSLKKVLKIFLEDETEFESQRTRICDPEHDMVSFECSTNTFSYHDCFLEKSREVYGTCSNCSDVVPVSQLL